MGGAGGGRSPELESAVSPERDLDVTGTLTCRKVGKVGIGR